METPHLPASPTNAPEAVSGPDAAEAVIQRGAALRLRHFRKAKLTPGYWLHHAGLWWAASPAYHALARLAARLQRSLFKRAEALRAKLKTGTPLEIPPERQIPEPPILFDHRYYKDQWKEKRRPKVSWWHDYLTLGWKHGLDPHPLFDVRFYLDRNPDVRAAGVDPLTHYLHKGWEEGRDPNPWFSTDWYLARNPELLAQNRPPLLDYLERGWKEGRDPGPRFSIARYYELVPNASRSVEPLGEWIAELADEHEGDLYREYVRWPLTFLPDDAGPVRAVGKVAVQIHAFYLDKLDLLLGYLRALPGPFDLLVSTDTPEHAAEIGKIVAQSGLDCGLDVRCAPNRGRDVAPLVSLFGKKLLEYDIALHIHTKKSTAVKADADYGAQWLLHNLNFLVRDAGYVRGVFSLFEENPHCGVLAPKPWKRIRRGIAWTSNRRYAEELMERLHLPPAILNTQPLMFPGGTMFWFRPAALRPLLDAGLTYDDFPPEPLPNDGSIAHAIERCIFYIALSQGYHSLVIAPSLYQPQQTTRL